MAYYENNSILKILRSFGPINLADFSDRLRLQKLAYLAQEMGAGDKYFYSWYVHGPYSSPLTSELFLGDRLGKFASEPPVLTENESKIVSQLKSLMGDEILNPHKLELFASIWYLLPSHKISKDDMEVVLDIMCTEKPHFSRDEVESAMKVIIDFKKSLKAS